MLRFLGLDEVSGLSCVEVWIGKHMAVTTYVSSYSKIESWGDELNRSRDDDETGQVFVFFKNFNLIPNQLNSSHSSAFIKDFEPDQPPHSSSIHPSIQLQYASQTTKTIIIIIILELTPLPHSNTHLYIYNSIILASIVYCFSSRAVNLFDKGFYLDYSQSSTHSNLNHSKPLTPL